MKKLRRVVASSSEQIFRVWYNPYNYPDEEDYIDVTAVDEDEARRKARSMGYVTEVEIKGDITARKTACKQSIKAATYNGFDESEFDKDQMDEIRKGLEAGVDINTYANPKFTFRQMEAIREGLEAGVDVSIYADPKYDGSQMDEILEGLEAGVDVSIYADPKFWFSKMAEIRKGLEAGVDVSWYADPKYDWSQMREIREGLEAGIDVSWYADLKYDTTQMMAIRDGLEDGLDISWYADPKFDGTQMAEIYNGLKHGEDVSIYADPKYGHLQMQKIRAKLRNSYQQGRPVNEKLDIEFYIETMRPTSKNTFNMSDKTITIKCVDYDPGQFDDDIENEDEYFASDLNATYGAVYKLKVTVKKLPEGFENAEEYANERIAERAQKAFPEGYSIE